MVMPRILRLSMRRASCLLSLSRSANGAVSWNSSGRQGGFPGSIWATMDKLAEGGEVVMALHGGRVAGGDSLLRAQGKGAMRSGTSGAGRWRSGVAQARRGRLGGRRVRSWLKFFARKSWQPVGLRGGGEQSGRRPAEPSRGAWRCLRGGRRQGRGSCAGDCWRSFCWTNSACRGRFNGRDSRTPVADVSLGAPLVSLLALSDPG